MTNLEYLEKAKDGKLEWNTVRLVCEHEIEYRKMKALEIIAETLIKSDVTLDYIETALEDIETAIINRR